AVGRVTENGKPGPDLNLILQVEVANETGGRVAYKGWGNARLTDAAGRAYRLRPGAEKSGGSIKPGPAAADMLVVGRRKDGGGALEVGLAGSAVGVTGTFRIRIPKEVWDRPATTKD